MGIEENKRIVLAWLKAFETEPAYHLLCDDVSWWAPGMGRISLEQFKVQMANIYKVLRTPVYLTIDYVTAEDDRVAVEARGRSETVDGRWYENTYHFLFILRGGKILEQREHCDTAHGREMLAGALLSDAK